MKDSNDDRESMEEETKREGNSKYYPFKNPFLFLLIIIFPIVMLLGSQILLDLFLSGATAGLRYLDGLWGAYKSAQVDKNAPPSREEWEISGLGMVENDTRVIEILENRTMSDTEWAYQIFRIKREYYKSDERAALYTEFRLGLTRKIRIENAAYIVRSFTEGDTR